MFKKALVALDLSPAELPIIECLPALQKWGVHQIVLTHVIQFGYAHGAGLAHQQEYEDWLKKSAQPLREAGFDVVTEVRASGIPATEILKAADENAADLIIIGSRGQNFLAKLFLGSVAREVIRNTTKPLLLEWIEPTVEATRANCEAVCTDTLRQILFATDFSEHAAAAEQAVLVLAPKAQHTECVHVLPAEKTGLSEQDTATARHAMKELVARIKAGGGKVAGTVLQGKPSVEIAHHADSQNATLIVVGKHGQNWIASKLIGSTAANICETAARPVLMVP